ncbi:hypothetical protein C0J52_03218 [Blattella germanica]|nr:hypothetical protein C0J52_03218 [Blattella germanica]
MMIKRLAISNAVVKFISLRTCPHVSRCLGTGDQTPAQILGSGDSIKIGESIQPVKLAYSSYESTKPTSNPIEWPVIIMHGLLGSKANWNAMSKMLHSKTKRKPELVEKLIVVDISPVNVSPSLNTMPKYFDAMKSVKLEGNIPLSKARKIADEQLAKHIPDVGTRQFLLTNLVEAEGGQYKWRINLESIARNFPNIASFPSVGTSCPVPTLFIAGEESDYIRPDDEDKVMRTFPAAEFEYVPGSGRIVHIKRPVEFCDVVSKFINKTSSRSRREQQKL